MRRTPIRCASSRPITRRSSTRWPPRSGTMRCRFIPSASATTAIRGPRARRGVQNRSDDETMVAARGLTKRYGDALAVDALDLDVPAGAFFGLLGPNGSGKTTAIHMLSTLIRPSAGEARVAGHDVRREPVAVRRAIGVVFQEPALDRSLSVEENLRLAGRLYGLPAAE